MPKMTKVPKVKEFCRFIKVGQPSVAAMEVGTEADPTSAVGHFLFDIRYSE